MGRPHDFPQTVVRLVRDRAGMRCSKPGCAAGTVMPSSDKDKRVIVGEAGHIRGPAGAPRHVPGMSMKDLRSVDNAIWLCRLHHIMVDADEAAFPAETLKAWKRNHEIRMSA